MILTNDWIVCKLHKAIAFLALICAGTRFLNVLYQLRNAQAFRVTYSIHLDSSICFLGEREMHRLLMSCLTDVMIKC